MTADSSVLFLHVLSPIGLFVALTLEGTLLIRIRTARTIDQARSEGTFNSELQLRDLDGVC